MRLIGEIGWTTWSAVSSGFARSSYVEIGWNLWGTLPHFLPQRIALESTAAALRAGRQRHRIDIAEMAETISELLATDAARVKLGARGISTAEAEQLPRNRHATARNPRGSGEEGERLMLIGQTDGGRVLTLVIERTLDPTTWLIVTGWPATDRERKILD